jgi:hypothetical protein
MMNYDAVEEVVAYFKVLSRYLPEGTVERQEETQSG